MSTITEQWALTAPAGPDLDRVCAEWMGPYSGRYIHWTCCGHKWTGFGWGSPECPECGREMHDAQRLTCKYSTDWSAAGPLMEAMNAFGICRDTDTGLPECYVPGGVTYMSVRASAESLLLAIARACAVLAARGVERGDI